MGQSSTIKVEFKKFLKTFKKHKRLFLFIPLIILASFSLGVFSQQRFFGASSTGEPNLAQLQEKVLPQNGYRFKINWRDLGKRMIEDGVIDEAKITFPENFKKYLEDGQKEIELNQENAQFWVDILWGLGLANKNRLLETGPMVEGGNTANFASTGGYTLGKKLAMEFYSKFSYINLTEEQQKAVEEVAENIYRPCCGNSTAFPDCNHGMAALALVELMVSQDKSQDEIYKTVLAFNSYWFPQTYLDIAYHFAKNGRDYKKVLPQEILSKTFSSIMGYQAVKRQIGNISWPVLQNGPSCGA